MGKSNIIIVTQLFPLNESSYAGKFIVDQLKAMQDSYSFTVITPIFLGPVNFIFSPHIRHKQIHGCDVYFVKHFDMVTLIRRIVQCLIHSKKSLLEQSKEYFSKEIVKLAKRLHAALQFRLVHGHELFIGDEAAQIGRVLNIPAIITIHGLYPLHRRIWGQPVMDRILANLRSADQLISVSKTAGHSYYQRLAGPRPPMSIIPNGIAEPEPAGPLDTGRQKQIAGRKIILGVGTLAEDKRWDLLLRAVARLPSDDYVVVLIGRGPIRPALERLTDELSIRHKVLFVGTVPPSDMGQWYEAATMLAHPSVIESFSMACLEAMAHKVPVVMTSVIGLSEYIDPGRDALVVPPDNIEALVEAVQKIITDNEFARTIGQQGYQRSLDFRWERVVPRIRDIYESLRS